MASSLINRSAVKARLLEEVRRTRNGKFTRVGADCFAHFDGILLNAIVEFVRAHPSVGKTLSLGPKSRSKGEAVVVDGDTVATKPKPKPAVKTSTGPYVATAAEIAKKS